jgi:hypothetical protein
MELTGTRVLKKFNFSKKKILALSDTTRGVTGRLQGLLPRHDELYFKTDEKKILQNCRSIVPNFMND